MSRSYKHFPYCNFRSGKVKKEMCRHYQHSLRQKLRNPDFQITGNQYKRVVSDTWDLFCGSYSSLKDYLKFEKEPPYYSWEQQKFVDEYNEEECVKFWKKWYYWK